MARLPCAPLLALCVSLFASPAGSTERGPAPVAAPRLPSSSASSVTVYGATWCSACKILERGLRERDIPFDVIDVDRSPDSYARARQAAGTNSIPLTSVTRGSDQTWVIGADVGAVERAYKGS
jgi:mycoredoxin